MRTVRNFLQSVLLASSVLDALAQTPDSIPFEPLEAPDTLRTLEAVRALEASHQVVHASEHRIAGTADEAKEPWMLLAEPWNDRWLVYALPVWREAQSGFEVLGFTEDGRYLRISQWSGHLARGHEISEADLYLVDLEQASFATINTHRFEQVWNTEDTTDLHGHITIDTTVLSITSDHVYLSCGCLLDGIPSPCEWTGGAYSITRTALVLDPSISVATIPQHNTGTRAPLTERDLLSLVRSERLCPSYHGPHAGLTELDSADRDRLLQHEKFRYTGSVLRYAARLPDAQGPVITLYCDRDDDHDLLWLAFDDTGRLVGLDTLASQWGDGQLARWECATVDAHGRLHVVAMEEETLRDEVDTMAYRRDTLIYAVRPMGIGVPGDDGEVHDTYRLERVPENLTSRWVEKHAVSDRGPHAWNSVKALIPADRRVLQAASGDLDRDGAEDHVFVLTDVEDSGPRDLLIAFTAADRGRFVPHALLNELLPDKSSGGFHDPIGEVGYSGVSVTGDTLIIAQFGGSAWKWQSVSKYLFDAARNGFFLVEERGRYYHAPSLETQDAELAELEHLRTRTGLSEEQSGRYAELQKMVSEAAWKVTRYPPGERPLGR